MKKLFTICVMLCCMMVAMGQEFTAITDEGYELKYEVMDAEAKTVECQGLVDKNTATSINLVIPDKMRYNGVDYKVTSIGNVAFLLCSGFTGSLTIPAGVESIGDQAFYGCTGFTGSLTIPVGVTSIGERAFEGCSGFTGSLTIPAGVTSIGNVAFLGCSGFTGSLTIPAGVESIGSRAFGGCSGFTGSLLIPAGVESIGDYVFYNCSGFTGSLTIGASVESIGDWTFADCCGFTGSLTIPAGVKSIGVSAFYGCSGFTGSLTIPDGVESIGSWAFNDCDGFSGSLTIGASVTSIGERTFYGCSGFTSVINKAVMPQDIPEYYSVFGGMCLENISLYVPEGSIDAYEGAAVWKNFKNIEALEDTALEDVVREMPFVQQGYVLTFAQPAFVSIFTVNGQLVRSGIMEQCVLPAERGVYVVQTVKGSFKVMVND